MRKKINIFFETRQSLKQFIQFCLVGGSNVIVMLITAWAFFYFFNANVYVGNTAGFITSVLNAYYWNLVWVFKHQKVDKRTALLKFFATYVFTYIFSMFLSFLFVDVLGGDKYLSPFINTAVTTPINFLLSKFWTFKGASVNEKEEHS